MLPRYRGFAGSPNTPAHTLTRKIIHKHHEQIIIVK